MTQITIFATSLIIAFILLYLGWLDVKDNGSGYAYLTGFVIILITGLVVLVSPISYISGEETRSYYIYGNEYDGYHYDDYNGTLNPSLTDLNLFHLNETSTIVYTENASVLNYVIGITLLLFGAYGAFNSFSYMRGKRRDLFN